MTTTKQINEGTTQIPPDEEYHGFHVSMSALDYGVVALYFAFVLAAGLYVNIH